MSLLTSSPTMASRDLAGIIMERIEALAGTLDHRDLERVEAQGIPMAAAVRSFGGNPEAIGGAKLDRKNLLGYLEIHIEQGPVLEKKRLSLGVVSAIAGQKRYGCR